MFSNLHGTRSCNLTEKCIFLDGETVVIAKPLHTMGPPFPSMEVRGICYCHLISLQECHQSQRTKQARY